MFKKFYEAIAHPVEPIPTPRPRLEMAFKWLLFTSCILLLGFLSAYFPIAANIPFIVIPSILVLLFAKPVLFEKMKLTTLVAVRTFCVFCVCYPMATSGFSFKQFYVDLVQLALVVNILEATFTDLLRHKKYFNAVSGFFLALGTIGLKGHWIAGAADPLGINYYLVFGATNYATICYIVGYTIWNWIFVTDEFSPSVALMHVGFLLSPIIGCVMSMAFGNSANPFGLWLLLRANTLSIGGWLQIGCKHWFEKEYYDEKFAHFINFIHTKPVQIVLMLVCIATMLACIIPAFTEVSGYTPFGFQREPWLYDITTWADTMPANW